MPRRGTHYRSRVFFLLFVVARPLAFGSLPARIMPTLRVGIWEIRRISHYKSRFIFIFIRGGTSQFWPFSSRFWSKFAARNSRSRTCVKLEMRFESTSTGTLVVKFVEIANLDKNVEIFS